MSALLCAFSLFNSENFPTPHSGNSLKVRAGSHSFLDSPLRLTQCPLCSKYLINLIDLLIEILRNVGSMLRKPDTVASKGELSGKDHSVLIW